MAQDVPSLVTDLPPTPHGDPPRYNVTEEVRVPPSVSAGEATVLHPIWRVIVHSPESTERKHTRPRTEWRCQRAPFGTLVDRVKQAIISVEKNELFPDGTLPDFLFMLKIGDLGAMQRAVQLSYNPEAGLYEGAKGVVVQFAGVPFTIVDVWGCAIVAAPASADKVIKMRMLLDLDLSGWAEPTVIVDGAKAGAVTKFLIIAP